jgi:hypothetical protein
VSKQPVVRPYVEIESPLDADAGEHLPNALEGRLDLARRMLGALQPDRHRGCRQTINAIRSGEGTSESDDNFVVRAVLDPASGESIAELTRCGRDDVTRYGLEGKSADRFRMRNAEISGVVQCVLGDCFILR